MDTLFIVTQLVMLVAVCLLMYFSVSTWLMLKMKPTKEKPTKVVLLEKKTEDTKSSRKRTIKG